MNNDWTHQTPGMTTPPGRNPDGVERSSYTRAQAPRAPGSEAMTDNTNEEWISVGDEGGAYVSWSKVTPGTVYEGTYTGLENGQYDNLNVKLAPWKELVEDAVVHEGETTKFLRANASLERQIKRVRVGAAVQVLFMGAQTLKGGKTFNLFDVRVRSKSDILPVATAATKGGDDLPF